MRFELEGLDVFFPYEKLYHEQYEYMLNLKRAIDAKGHALLEMPTGTGKTVCLVSLVTSYQFQYPQTGKLIYCTRTVQEMFKCMDEIRRVIAYRESMVGPEGGKVLALCLSSRKNMCIHPRVEAGVDREAVDSICRSMTATWVRQSAGKARPGERGDRGSNSRNGSSSSSSTSSSSGNRSSSGSRGGGNGNAVAGSQSAPDIEDVTLCSFYEKYVDEESAAEIPGGVYSLDDLKSLGKEKGWCPYFVARHMLNRATIVVYNYQYMLDPKVANLVSRELEQESIVVFDEAHNIDNVCIEAFSITLDRRKMDASLKGVHRLGAKITEQVNRRKEDFANEYRQLVQGLITEGAWAANDQGRGNPVLSEDQLQEAVPGSIRKNEHFVAFLKKIVVFFRTLMDGQEVTRLSALQFLMNQGNGQVVDRKAMKFTASRLNSLMRLLEISKLEEFSALLDVATFATLLATYTEEGFQVVFEPQGSMVQGINEPLLQLCCLDASIAIKPVFERFQSVIITSGTLSPIADYAKLLNFEPVIKTCLPMSTFRDCLLPLIVTRGRDQVPISSKFESRMDDAVIRNFGELLVDTCATVPDGVCAFFTSYSYMEQVLAKWDEWDIISRIQSQKLIFMETKDVLETQQALDNFKRSCDLGRGAVFLSIARGKVAEGVDFDRHYGRCVLLFGIPIQYTQSHVLRARMDYVLQKYQIREQEFLVFDALRQAAQCVGRVIRSKEDYGIVILADFRYNKQDKRNKMPQWIQQFLRESSLNVSTDVAIDQMKAYLKLMGQPIDRGALERIVLDEAQVKEKQRKVSVYRQQETQAEISRINRQAQAFRPGLFNQGQGEAAVATTTGAGAGACAGGGGFEMDQEGIEALARERAEEEQEEIMRREAEAYIEEEEEALREVEDELLPEGSVLERRQVDKDLLLSINKRSEDALNSNTAPASGSLKRGRDNSSSSTSTSSSSSMLSGGLMMFMDSDDEG